MNVLPLVLAFLIIFSCIASSFLREMKSFFAAETALEGYQRTERAVDNAIAKKTYKKKKGKSLSPKKETKGGRQTQKEYTSRRTRFPPYENAKFNLFALTAQQGPPLKQHPLYEPLAALLRLLYKERLFDKIPDSEEIEHRLIEAMIAKARTAQDFALTDLRPDDPTLAKVYYKMLKGTNQYSDDKGIPPLNHFIAFQKRDHALSLSFAAPQVLEAFFGKECAEHILSTEQSQWVQTKKYHYFSKEELQTLVQKSPLLAPKLALFEPYLDLSKKFAPRHEIAGKDKTTKITVEKTI